MPVAFMMIGLPGSGKSVIARRLAQRYNLSLIEGDAYWPAILHSRYGLTPNDLRMESPESYHIGRLVEARVRRDLRRHLALGKSVILDGCHISREYRQKRIAACRVLGATCVFGLWVRTPLGVCLARCARPRFWGWRVEPSLVLSFYKLLMSSEPNENEGFDRLKILKGY